MKKSIALNYREQLIKGGKEFQDKELGKEFAEKFRKILGIK